MILLAVLMITNSMAYLMNDHPTVKEQCFCTNSSGTQCEWISRPIEVVSTTSNRIIHVNLPDLTTCMSNNYIVTLLVDETAKNLTDCDHVSYQDLERHQQTRHTQIWYNREDKAKCDCPDDSIEVRFDYVFTGCYVLKMTVDGDVVYVSKPTVIQTGYVKETLMENICINVQFRRNETTVNLLLNTTDSDRPGYIYADVYEIDDDYETVVTEDCTIPADCTFYNRTINGNYARVELNCRSSNATIYTWTYTDLAPSLRYAFEYRVVGEPIRCDSDTLWAVSCSRWFPFVVKNIQEAIGTNNEPTYIPDYVLIASCVIILSALVVSVIACPRIYNTCRQNRDTVMIRYVDRTEILLVYARDCDAFMEMIAKFKNLLQSAGPTETIIHDLNEYNEEMNNDRTFWLTQKLMDPTIKVLVVFNDCGAVIYDRKLRNPYLKPKYQDGLFLYVLEQLSALKERRSLPGLFLLNLDGTGNCRFLHNRKRHLLPDGLGGVIEAVFGVTVQKSLLFNDFVEQCLTCSEFYKDNPTYVSDMLRSFKN